MSSLNKVLLIGNVGRVDAKATSGGKMATFTLATKERYKDRSGNQKEETTWHNLVAYGPLADIVDQYVNKGSQIYIEGRLRKTKYTDKNGIEKEGCDVMVSNIQLLDKSSSNNSRNYSNDPF